MKIEVEIPDHLANIFLVWLSENGEQEFPEWAYDVKTPGTYISFDYPGWKDKVIIREIE